MKVADFGPDQGSPADAASHRRGFTPLFAPPELVRGTPQPEQRSVTVWQSCFSCCSRDNLLRGADCRATAAQHLSSPPDLSGLPTSDRAAVGRALSKSSLARYPSCRLFVDHLAHGTAPRARLPRLREDPVAPAGVRPRARGTRRLPLRGGDKPAGLPPNRCGPRPEPRLRCGIADDFRRDRRLGRQGAGSPCDAGYGTGSACRPTFPPSPC